MGTNRKVDFDNYVGDYNDLLRKSTSLFSPSEEYFARYKIEIARRVVVGEVHRVHEFGCGIGRNVPFLKELFPGAEVVGTDISSASVEEAAKENSSSKFYVEREHLDIGQFDLVFVAGVFHHVPVADRAAVMRTVASRLAPGGTLIVFEHNPYNPVTRKIVNSCPYDEDAVLVPPKEMAALINGVGLRILGKEYCLFVPPKLSVFSPLERLVGWLPLGGQYYIKAGR